jgi:glycosyltransferase involved in cell wall biosynthesis
MNVLLINHYAGSNKYGMEYRPYYFAREFVKLGHRVTIVAGSYSHLRSVQPKVTGSIEREDLDGIRYIWLKTGSYSGNGVKRFLSMLQFVYRLVASRSVILEQSRPDVVIASSTYPLDIYPAHLLAKSSKARLIYEVHDLWPLSPMELGGMSRWHPFIMMMQHAEDYAYRNADLVVSMLPKADEHMRNHGMAPRKFAYVPNGIVVDEWESGTASLPPQHTDLLAELKRQGKFLVGYAGAHGLANALDQLTVAAAQLKHLPASIILVGQGPDKPNLEKYVKDKSLDNVFFLPPVSKSSIPALLAAMDALYIGLQRQPLFRFGISPNKLMDYMMAGKPVINAIEAGNDPVAESGCGISVCSENSDAIAEAIQELMGMNEAEREVMGMRGKEYVLKHHDYRVLARKFVEIME